MSSTEIENIHLKFTCDIIMLVRAHFYDSLFLYAPQFSLRIKMCDSWVLINVKICGNENSVNFLMIFVLLILDSLSFKWIFQNSKGMVSMNSSCKEQLTWLSAQWKSTLGREVQAWREPLCRSQVSGPSRFGWCLLSSQKTDERTASHLGSLSDRTESNCCSCT